MASTSAEISLHDQTDTRLNVPYLLRFSLPLALTFLMMSGAAPLVSSGIAWMQGAEGERLHLSAFLMTFATSTFIYSPMFIARNVAIRTITGRSSLWAFAAFFSFWATLTAILLIVVSQVDAVGHLLFGQVLGVSLEVEHLARQGMLVFVPIPLLVALRGLGQGCHITNGDTWYVGLGTGLRLAVMALFVFGYAVHSNMSGPMLGGMTYLLGIGTEMVFVLAMLRGKPQLKAEVGRPMMGFGQFTRFAGPLMLGSLFHQLSGPILLYMINYARLPGENGASYDLIRGTVWIMVSMLMAIQPVVINHATSRANFRIIVRFAFGLVAAITVVALLLALTDLRELIFVSWLRVDNTTILSLTFTCLLWLIPVPAITLVNHFMISLHTRSGRTTWVTIGGAAGLMFLLSMAWALDLAAYDGVILAVVGHALFQLSSALVQAVGLLGGGFRSAIERDTMIEKLQAKLIPREEYEEDVAFESVH